ncbi:Uncharacterised protein [Mycobacteroides abscessus subsp. abscessus]|nr:Uncharacterised protein [Mycobacteroides abscessus subsp. abscessus]
MSAEDDRIAPHVADDVAQRVGGGGLAECAGRCTDVALGHRGGCRSRKTRIDHVVLADLATDLVADVGEVAAELSFGLRCTTLLADLEMLRGNAPLEEEREQRVVDEVAVVERTPPLVARHAEQSVTHVVVHAEHVGVLVMDVVVGVLPVSRGVGVVPLPRGRMHLGIVHPIPLPVHHVVAEFHVLDDLRDAERRRARPPARATRRTEDQSAADQLETALEADRVAQIPRVALPPVGFDVGADLVELATELFDVGLAQMCVLRDVGDRHGRPHWSRMVRAERAVAVATFA